MSGFTGNSATVHTGAELSANIQAADNLSVSGVYSIEVSGSIDLCSGTPPAINLQSGVIANQIGSGASSGAGRLVINGDATGVVLLTASNTYDGGTMLNTGTLGIGFTGAIGSGDVAFNGSNATLRYDAIFTGNGAQTLANGVTGFATGDTIDLRGLTSSGGDSVAMAFADMSVVAVDDGNGGAKILSTADPAACFLAGTHILTERGYVRIEELREGEDWVITADGSSACILWIGRRAACLAGHPRPWDVMPVRIVQEDHDSVTWYHVELAFHGAILAEGLAADSDLDTGNRPAFDNAGPVVVLDPVFACPRRPLKDDPKHLSTLFSYYKMFKTGTLPDDGGVASQSRRGWLLLNLLDSYMQKAEGERVEEMRRKNREPQ